MAVKINSNFVFVLLAGFSLLGAIGIVVTKKGLELKLADSAAGASYQRLYAPAFGKKADEIKLKTDSEFTCSAVTQRWDEWIGETNAVFGDSSLTTESTQIKGRCQALQSMVGLSPLIFVASFYHLYASDPWWAVVIASSGTAIVWTSVVLGITMTQVTTEAKDGAFFQLDVPDKGPSLFFYIAILIGQIGTFLIFNPKLNEMWVRMGLEDKGT